MKKIPWDLCGCIFCGLEMKLVNYQLKVPSLIVKCRSLSRKDIQIIVERGCPNLFRKAVNSAKRLRAYVQLDEGDVSSSVFLSSTCHLSFQITKYIHYINNQYIHI